MGAKENKVERHLIKRVRGLNGISYKWTSPGHAGVPDRICIIPFYGVLFVEVKAVDGVLSDHQLRVLNTLHGAGADTAVVRGVYDVDCMLEEWLGHVGVFRWGF